MWHPSRWSHKALWQINVHAAKNDCLLLSSWPKVVADGKDLATCGMSIGPFFAPLFPLIYMYTYLTACSIAISISFVYWYHGKVIRNAIILTVFTSQSGTLKFITHKGKLYTGYWHSGSLSEGYAKFNSSDYS